MTASVTRFSSRAQVYAKYRPTYPPGVVDILISNCRLTNDSVIADVGSGTGFLTELFLLNGNKVFGVEPNEAMRVLGEQLLSKYPLFESVAGTAEATTLESQSVEFITAAQAFHWFDRERAKEEFTRILQPNGWVVLIWNERKLDSTPFLRDYEELLLRYGTDYQEVRHENVYKSIADFFSPNTFEHSTLENFQHFDWEGLKGRVCSASYTPEPDDSRFTPMIESLKELFDQHNEDGIVSFEYDTTVYYGHLGGERRK